MAGRNEPGKIYSATYSNVPVYETFCEGNHVMRRRADDYINATHILKVALYDKPTRTRILEREVQKGIHEKVQGGYGKYQGTWIPLKEGVDLATKNNVFGKLQHIFDFVPGDRSPPPAPKHLNKPPNPKPSKQSQARRVPVPVEIDPVDEMDEDGTPDNITVMSSPYHDPNDPHYTNSRKRRRVEDQMSQADKEHQLWAEDLLDYFMLQDSPFDAVSSAPLPPRGVDLDRPIDDKGHTALHWAAAMGDEMVVRELIRRGASIDVKSKNGETPLMRTVVFTNSHDQSNMDKLAGMLINTVSDQEIFGSTVFHHIANTTHRKSKYQCARYYMDSLLDKMTETFKPTDIEHILNIVDQHGDTAITIAARNGARKCVRSLIGRHAAVDIANYVGQTADELIVQLNSRRHERLSSHRQMSSSPFQADGHNSGFGGAVQPPTSGPNGLDPYGSQVNGNSQPARAFQTDPAITLDSHIIPLFQEKAKALAANIDHEIEEKDNELREAERVANMRRVELGNLRQQAKELEVQEQDQTKNGMETDEVLEAELKELEETCRALEDEESTYDRQITLRELGDADAADLQAHHDERGLVQAQLALARELITVQRDRQDLVKQIVQALSHAGYGNDTQREQYKRLIVGALGVREQDIESMLPDIVAELEDARSLENSGA